MILSRSPAVVATLLVVYSGGQGLQSTHAPVWEPQLAFATPPATPSSTHEPPTSIRLPLYNVRDQFYYFKMQVGTPPQIVRMVLDTAATEIGITTVKNGTHLIYDRSSSSTYKHDGRPWAFRDGMAGVLVSDRLGLFNYTGSVNSTVDHHFVEITNVSSYGLYYADMPFDGWFGLGQNETESVGGFPTFVREITKLGVLDRPCVHLLMPQGKNGEILFGSGNDLGIEFTKVPIDPRPGLWGFDVGEIKVGNTSVRAVGSPSPATASTLGYAALDNTRPYIIGPADAVNTITKALGATPFSYGRFSVPCDATLPDVSFWSATTPSDEVFTFTTSELVGRRVSETDCELKIVQRPEEEDTQEIADWVMGMPVFHRYHFGLCWSKIPGGTPVLTKALHV